MTLTPIQERVKAGDTQVVIYHNISQWKCCDITEAFAHSFFSTLLFLVCETK